MMIRNVPLRRASPIDTTSFPGRFPLTYSDRTSITVNAGWQATVEELFAALEAIARVQSARGEMALTVQEVHQKYGSLRAMTSRATAESERLVDDAERKSLRICEFCSAPARSSELDDWTVTLCESCLANIKR